MASNNAQNVSFGKPKATGVIYRAPLGTPLPTDATTDLPAAWENIGFVSEDGISRTTDSDTAEIKEMGGLTVLNVITSSSESIQFVAIETNKETLAMRYGTTNVEETDAEYVVTHKGVPTDAYSYVIEIILTGNRADRSVIPNATISEIGDTTYNGSDAIGYDVTLSCNADDAIDGGTVREYIVKPKTTTLPSGE